MNVQAVHVKMGVHVRMELMNMSATVFLAMSSVIVGSIQMNVQAIPVKMGQLAMTELMDIHVPVFLGMLVSVTNR